MKYLVVDISTAAQPDLEDSYYLAWENRNGSLTPEEAYSKAGRYAEYGMICGLSAHWVNFIEEDFKYKEAMTAGASGFEEEEKLLLDFEELLDKDVALVGYNLKEFIVPFLAKRFLGNGLRVPKRIFETIHSIAPSCDIMKELSCGGAIATPLRGSAWMFRITDPLPGWFYPDFCQLCKEGRTREIERITKMNSQTAARVFGNCVLGGLIQLNNQEK